MEVKEKLLPAALGPGYALGLWATLATCRVGCLESPSELQGNKLNYLKAWPGAVSGKLSPAGSHQVS